jgi:SAM-dependent methyltransferase
MASSSEDRGRQSRTCIERAGTSRFEQQESTIREKGLAMAGTQKGEKCLWDGLLHSDYHILQATSDNASKAPGVMGSLGGTPEKSLEVGIGPFGLGISAFLPEISFRLALDPLPPVSLNSSPHSELHSTYELRAYMQHLRAPIHYVQGCGEEMPDRTGTIDLVICCNVLDHVCDPDAVLREIHRVLKSDGCLYFDVDTFSLCGLVKWYLWTKHAHAEEILVTAHPYRMLEGGLVRKVRAAGFRLRKLGGHTLVSKIVGHARVSTFLATKCFQ